MITEPIRVSRHAQRRYHLRVNAACLDPRPVLWAMWNQGIPATNEDMRLYGAHRTSGYDYRVVVANNGLRFLAVWANGVLITLLEVVIR